MTPTTWEAGCREVILLVMQLFGLKTTLDDWETNVPIDEMVDFWVDGANGYAQVGWADLAARVIKAHVEFVQGGEGEPWKYGYVVQTLASKQHDYGTRNIERFGIPGIKVRLSDKAARFRNLRRRGGNARNETVEDTLFDMLGYCIVALMVLRGTFTLPLEADLAEDEDDAWADEE